MTVLLKLFGIYRAINKITIFQHLKSPNILSNKSLVLKFDEIFLICGYDRDYFVRNSNF